jgi:hypothetical protein
MDSEDLESLLCKDLDQFTSPTPLADLFLLRSCSSLPEDFFDELSLAGKADLVHGGSVLYVESPENGAVLNSAKDHNTRQVADSERNSIGKEANSENDSIEKQANSHRISKEKAQYTELSSDELVMNNSQKFTKLPSKFHLVDDLNNFDSIDHHSSKILCTEDSSEFHSNQMLIPFASCKATDQREQDFSDTLKFLSMTNSTHHFNEQTNTIHTLELKSKLHKALRHIYADISLTKKYKEKISRVLESSHFRLASNSQSSSFTAGIFHQLQNTRLMINAKFPFSSCSSGWPLRPQIPPNLDQSLISHLESRPIIAKTPKWSFKEREQLARGIRQQNLRILANQIAVEESNEIALKEKIEALKAKSLTELEMNVIGIDWDRISAAFVPTRSAFDCKVQWTIHSHPMINKSSWSSEESKELLEIAQKHYARDWVSIAQKLGTNRTAIECFMHYQRHLNKEHVQIQWSTQDDEMLKLAVKMYGTTNWNLISNCLNGKQPQHCQSRWQKTLSSVFRKGKWSETEDKALLEAVRLYGKQSWFKIQQFVPGRTDVQCRERYCNILDPKLNQGPWSFEEDEKLLQLVAELGNGKWATISKQIEGRTDNQCWRRWRQLNTGTAFIRRSKKRQKK